MGILFSFKFSKKDNLRYPSKFLKITIIQNKCSGSLYLMLGICLLVISYLTLDICVLVISYLILGICMLVISHLTLDI